MSRAQIIINCIKKVSRREIKDILKNGLKVAGTDYSSLTNIKNINDLDLKLFTAYLSGKLKKWVIEGNLEKIHLLHYFTKIKQYRIINLLLELNPRTDLYDNNGRLLAETALKSGNFKIFRLLHKKGCKHLNDTDTGRKMTIASIENGSIRLIKKIKKLFPNENSVSDQDIAIACVKSGRYTSFKYHYQGLMNVLKKSAQEYFLKLFISAVEGGCYRIVKELIDLSEEKLTSLKPAKDLLAYATLTGNNLRTLKLLREKNLINVFATHLNGFEFSFLEAAANRSRSDFISFLQNHIKSIDEKMSEHIFSSAVYSSNIKSVRIVLKAANLNLKKMLHSHPDFIFDAIASENLKILTLFLRNGGSLMVTQTMTGRNLFHNASENKNTRIIKFILKNNPDFMNSKDNTGETALHSASQSPYYQGVELLLKTGLDPKIKSVYNKTAYDYASEIGFPMSAFLLMKRK